MYAGERQADCMKFGVIEKVRSSLIVFIMCCESASATSRLDKTASK